MSSKSHEPPEPGDIPPLLELRQCLQDAFLAVVRRYEHKGLSENEAREYASAFIIALLKKATFEVEPPSEDASVGELWNYLLRQRPRTWWIILSAMITLLVAAFTLGAVLE